MRRAVGIGVVLAAASLAAACSGHDGVSGSATTTTESLPAPTEWATAGADLANTRSVRGGDLDASTVDGLHEVWRSEIPSLGSLSTVPLVVDGTVYVGGGSGQVAALDATTGKTVWLSEATGLNIGPYGVAVDGDRVYALDSAAGVAALDRATGTEVWSTDVTATDSTGIDIQPIVAGDVVLVSSVPISLNGIYAPGDRGVVTALDKATGEVRWTFDTVKGDLWGHPEVNSGGGAWYPPAVDLERGLVYVGTANPAPFPGTVAFPNGTSRPGDNLYTDSLVALDLETGKLAWYHQVTEHDIFDRDQVHAQLVSIDGGDVVVSSGKSGVVVGLDPDDGTLLWETEVGVHDGDDLTELDGPTTITPGTYGGVLTPPAASGGVVFMPVLNAPAELKPDAVAYFGTEMGQQDGEVVAIDAATGEVVWDAKVPGDPLGAATVINDLVVTVLLDGTLVALDRETGDILRTLELGAGTNGWLSVAGDTLFVPAGVAPPATIIALGL